MITRTSSALLAGFAFFGLSVAAFAGDATPECMTNGTALTVDNAQVLGWKESSHNQFAARALISGTYVKTYPAKDGHQHFQVKLGNNSGDTIEVIYNIEFGKLPDLTPGMTVEACGDYITSNAAAGGYKASPDAAIMHWVHRSQDDAKHPSGFLVIGGQLEGFDPNSSGMHGHY